LRLGVLAGEELELGGGLLVEYRRVLVHISTCGQHAIAPLSISASHYPEQRSNRIIQFSVACLRP
jgi:hypothetical protein